MAVVLIDLFAALTIVWLFQLVRGNRLYVGYGVIFMIALAAGGLIVTLSAPLMPLVGFVGSPKLLTALMCFVGGAITLMFIYILSQMSLLSNRVTALTQELAVRHALSSSPSADVLREGGNPESAT